MTEDLKGSKDSAEDLKHGDTAWLRVKIESPDVTMEGNRVVSFLMKHSTGHLTRSDILASVSDLQPYSVTPSNSETAELERDVIEAARTWARGGVTDCSWNLQQAVQTLENAFAPPSLEEQLADRIRVLVNDIQAGPYRATETPTGLVASVTVDILALVKAHQ